MKRICVRMISSFPNFDISSFLVVKTSFKFKSEKLTKLGTV